MNGQLLKVCGLFVFSTLEGCSASYTPACSFCLWTDLLAAACLELLETVSLKPVVCFIHPALLLEACSIHSALQPEACFNQPPAKPIVILFFSTMSLIIVFCFISLCGQGGWWHHVWHFSYNIVSGGYSSLGKPQIYP